MSIDTQLFLYLNNALSGELATAFFSLVTRLGNGWVLTALVAPAFFFFDRQKLRTHLIPMALSVAFGGLVVGGVKVAVNRPRPPEYFLAQGVEVHAPLGSPSDRSFPSGHTQAAFGAAVFLCCMYPAVSPFFLLAALLVGFSRIAIGVHFPLDVLVGGILGSAFSYLGFRLNSLRLERKKDRSEML